MNTPTHDWHRLAYSGLCRLESAHHRAAMRRRMLAVICTAAGFLIIYLWSYLP